MIKSLLTPNRVRRMSMFLIALAFAASGIAVKVQPVHAVTTWWLDFYDSYDCTGTYLRVLAENGYGQISDVGNWKNKFSSVKRPSSGGDELDVYDGINYSVTFWRLGNPGGFPLNVGCNSWAGKPYDNKLDSLILYKY
jgi:hypothetical protein